MLMEAIEDFQRFFINHFSRNRVLSSWYDELIHFLHSRLTWKNGVIITELVQEARSLIWKACISVALI
jgi:hypothetical protein